MHFSAKRGIAIVILSVGPSVYGILREKSELIALYDLQTWCQFSPDAHNSVDTAVVLLSGRNART